MVFGVFSPGKTQCIAPKKLPDKAMSIWNLHKKFQLSSAMGLRHFDLQSQPTLMGGNPLIVVQWDRDHVLEGIVDEVLGTLNLLQMILGVIEGQIRGGYFPDCILDPSVVDPTSQ